MIKMSSVLSMGISFCVATSSVSAIMDSTIPSCDRAFRSRLIQPNLSPQLRYLSMTPCIPHPMTPYHLAFLEHEFSADLLDISTLQRPAATLHALVYRPHDCAEQAALDVIRLLAPEVERPRHAEDVV